MSIGWMTDLFCHKQLQHLIFKMLWRQHGGSGPVSTHITPQPCSPLSSLYLLVVCINSYIDYMTYNALCSCHLFARCHCIISLQWASHCLSHCHIKENSCQPLSFSFLQMTAASQTVFQYSKGDQFIIQTSSFQHFLLPLHTH